MPSCFAKWHNIIVKNITILYPLLDYHPVWPDLDESHWLQQQSSTGNLHCCHLEVKMESVLPLLDTWSYMTANVSQANLTNRSKHILFLLPITLNVRCPSPLAWRLHWPGCMGGSRLMRYRPLKCSKAARGPCSSNRDWLWSNKERKVNNRAYFIIKSRNRSDNRWQLKHLLLVSTKCKPYCTVTWWAGEDTLCKGASDM